MSVQKQTKKATYTATSNKTTQNTQQPAPQQHQPQQPQQPQLRSPLVLCPTCRQPYPARYGKCPRCPRKVNPIIKFIIMALFISFVVLSGLKTFVPDWYEPIKGLHPVMEKVDNVIPAFTKPVGNYIVPE